MSSRSLQFHLYDFLKHIMTFSTNCTKFFGADTTGIRLFAECSALCRVQFIEQLTKHALPNATLGEQRHSA
jgi:hypothetical protein